MEESALKRRMNEPDYTSARRKPDDRGCPAWLVQTGEQLAAGFRVLSMHVPERESFPRRSRRR